MKSIRARVLVFTIAGTLALLAVASLLWYRQAQTILVREFDRGLQTRTSTLASLLDHDDDKEGVITLDLIEETAPEYMAGDTPAYFQIWHKSGKPIARSQSLGKRNLPNRKATWFDLTLPDGRDGRAYGTASIVRDDIDDDEKNQPKEVEVVARPDAPVRILVACSRQELDEAIASLLFSVLLVGGGVGLGILAMVYLVVAQGLAPLQDLSREVACLDARNLPARLKNRNVPSELSPVIARLNELLKDVRQAMERERRTTSNIAHELKTPIAELRALSDVAMKWPEDVGYRKRALEEVNGIAVQMEALAETVLGLSRAESGQLELEPEVFDLRTVLHDLEPSLQRRARKRGLGFEVDHNGEALVEADRAVVRILLSNLLSNAVDHTPKGEAVDCSLHQKRDRVVVRIHNHANGLKPEDIPHLTERFWRKDEARTNGQHAGLGLALANQLSELTDSRLNFKLVGVDLRTELSFVHPYQAPQGKKRSAAQRNGRKKT